MIAIAVLLGAWIPPQSSFVGFIRGLRCDFGTLYRLPRIRLQYITKGRGFLAHLPKLRNVMSKSANVGHARSLPAAPTCWRHLRGTAPLLLACVFSTAVCAGNVAGPTTLTPDQQAIISKITDPALAKGDTFSPTASSIGARLRLPLRDGKFVSLVRKGSRIRSDGSIAWWGEVEETGERAVLSLWNNALLTGFFAYNGVIYAVENAGGGIAAVAELGRANLPDHPDPTSRPQGDVISPPNQTAKSRTSPPEPAVPSFPDSERKALEAKDIVIDVMLLYTPRVAKHYIRDPEDLLSIAIGEANQTFRNSGLGNIHLRLVHTQLVDYDASADDQFNHLYTMVDGLGPFKDVKKLRNEKHADIVGLIIDNPRGCGLSTRIGPDSDEAFFVVHHACATITLSITHEIGHILGVRHDRLVDGNDQPFAYGHGFVNGTKWRDIMSYNEGCGGCPRIPYWSNPRVMYEGEPTGTPAADSARVILQHAERISKFR